MFAFEYQIYKTLKTKLLLHQCSQGSEIILHTSESQYTKKQIQY